jgi:hypothetical protein
MMKISDQATLFLRSLYLKSKQNLTAGYDAHIVGRLAQIERSQIDNIRNYLKQQGFIELGQFKGDDKVYLTSFGIDKVENELDNQNNVTLKFLGYRYMPPTSRAITEIHYYYTIIGEGYDGNEYRMRAIISDRLQIGWGYPLWSYNPENEYRGLVKILLVYIKDRLIKKIQEGTTTTDDQISFFSDSHPNERPFDPDSLADVSESEYLIDLPSQNISGEIAENRLAASIIETRDTINNLFHAKHGKKLLLLNEERNLLDFFKAATTSEEFSHRISSLAQVSRNFDKNILKSLLSKYDDTDGSVVLLKKFLDENGKNTNPAEILKHIGRIRQGYPAHADNTGMAGSLKYFGLRYPITDFQLVWTTLLNQYLVALKNLQESLLDLY